MKSDGCWRIDVSSADPESQGSNRAADYESEQNQNELDRQIQSWLEMAGTTERTWYDRQVDLLMCEWPRYWTDKVGVSLRDWFYSKFGSYCGCLLLFFLIHLPATCIAMLISPFILVYLFLAWAGWFCLTAMCPTKDNESTLAEAQSEIEYEK